ncbi:MAG TPA: hypothetical protein VKB39_08765 [Candidatus Baltobacteraceae bacterium]|nr:hypothetical protein [Candidatus Baltobacteraceae bacterium]
MNDPLSLVIDRIAVRDWDGANEALQALQARDEERVETAAELRHELANAVAIVRANVEGMLDGVLEPTRERLEALREALAGITVLLEAFSKIS